MKKLLLSALVIIAAFACEKDPSGKGLKSNEYLVCGKVEKGPFVNGSTIKLQPLDANYNPTGSIFLGDIVDHTGYFNLGKVNLSTPYATLTAEGYFFNEVTGRLSKGPLTLNAIVDLRDKSSVNVNILTHLKYYRIRKLLGKGMSFKDADTQAQKELFDAFSLGAYNEGDASQFSITSGTDQAGVTIAISSLLLTGLTEAQVTESLAKLGQEFGENGFFSTETKERLHIAMFSLIGKTEAIAQNVITRYEFLGQNITVKDLAMYLDWDGNGVPGDEVIPEGSAITADRTEIEFPAEGGTYTVKVSSPVSLYLEVPSPGYTDTPPADILTADDMSLYDTHEFIGMDLDASIANNEITINVAKTNSRAETTEKIHVYDYFGNNLITVTVAQKGDKSLDLPGLSSQGEQFVGIIAESFADAMSAIDLLERMYSHNSSYGDIKAPLSPSDSRVSQTWDKLYLAIGRINQMRDQDARGMAVYGPLLDFFSSLCYLPMTELWGALPYIMKAPQIGEEGSPRTDDKEIVADIVRRLELTLDVTNDKKDYGYDWTAKSLFFMPNNFVKVLLGKALMKAGNYEEANAYLQEVRASGYYKLDEDPYMFGLKRNNAITKAEIDLGQNVIIFSYCEVLLSLAECRFRLGDETGALAIVNEVGTAKGWPQVTEGKQVIRYILQLRKENKYPGMFAFLKRNALAEEELGLTSSNYLLLPLPQGEVTYNTLIVQNPGY